MDSSFIKYVIAPFMFTFIFIISIGMIQTLSFILPFQLSAVFVFTISTVFTGNIIETMF